MTRPYVQDPLTVALEERDDRIRELEEERDIFARTLDKRDAELFEESRRKHEALLAQECFMKRIRELEEAVSRVSKAFSGDSIHDKCAIGYLMDCLTDEQKASLQALEGE